MPQIVTETYQIMLGVDAADVNAVAVGPACKDRTTAAERVKVLRALQQQGALDDAATAGKTFFVKAVAGTVTVNGGDALAAYQEFLASRLALVLYVRTAGGAYIRYGALPAETLGVPT